MRFPCRVLLVAAALLAAPCGWIWTSDARDESWVHGRAATRSHRYAEAAEQFRIYRERHPDDPDGWVMEGWNRKRLGEPDEADRLFRRALDLEPGQPDALYHFAERAWERRELSEARRELERIKEVPSNIEKDYHHMFGAVLALLDEDPHGALRHLHAAGRQDDATLVLEALSYVRTGQRELALRTIGSICPVIEDESRITAWGRCLDVDYCGELLTQRLAIYAGLIESGDYPLKALAEAVRIHLRHGADPGVLLDRLDGLTMDEPESCTAYLLLGLGYETRDDRERSCAAYRSSLRCLAGPVSEQASAVSGMVRDPVTGAAIDVTAPRRALRLLIEQRCAVAALDRDP